MERMIVQARVSSDGVLHLDCPLDPVDAGRDVQVTIDPLPMKEITPEDWREFVRSTAGSVTDAAFVRYEQGIVEERVELP